MTTTAHEDQFTPSTQTIESVHAPYEPVAILKRNVAELELALKRQTERAEKTEAELAKLREQKPVAWRHENGNIFLPWQKDMIVTGAVFSPLFAAPVPAPHPGATHCEDCGLTWLDDGLNPLRCPYCKDTVPAPAVPNDIIPEGDDFNGTTPHLIQCIESLVRLDAKGVLVPHGIGRDASKLLTAAANRLRQQAPAVPEEWREVMAELASDLQAACASERNARRYLALRKVGVQVPGYDFVKFDWSLDAAADRLLEGGE